MVRKSLDREWKFTPKSLDSFSLAMPIDRVVNLPHDFTIETDVKQDATSGKNTGFFEGGIGSYVKEIEIPEEWREKRILLEFDGAYMCTEVTVNGHQAAFHPYGYTPFHADLAPYVKVGRKNRIVVTTNNSMPDNGRWYSGSGLYRHVDLLTAPMIHLAPWSIFAYSQRIDENSASVMVEITVENHTRKANKKLIKVLIYKDGSNEVAATGSMVMYLAPNDRTTDKVQIVVNNPEIWDIESPKLYIVKAELCNMEEEVLDTDDTLFGIRSISVDRENGFMLNGRTLKLKGGCVHHDNGILGAASFYDSEYRKMKLHKEHGFNAIRCAHNPPSRDMLKACDRLGLLVLNEAFDVWKMKKNNNDYHLFFENWWKIDMELFMTRDRNHPCIIMWSTGNEIMERNGLGEGYKLAKDLADCAHNLDKTRPITNSIPVPFNGLEDEDMIKSMMSLSKLAEENNGSIQNLGNPYSMSIWAERTEAFAASLDVVGYNYMEYRYKEDGENYPSRIICGTESYPNNIDLIWDEVEKYPFVIGDFTWTSYDYIGEAGLGISLYTEPDDPIKIIPFAGPPVNYPWRLSYDADFDLCGIDRPQLHFRKVVWGSDETYITVHHPKNWDKKEHLGNWAWPESYHDWTFDGYEDKQLKVDVLSAADEVELILNGKSMGKAAAGKVNRFKAQFEVKYEPGNITAVSYTNNKEVSRDELVTVGKACDLKVNLETPELRADGQNLLFVTVEVVDKEGRHVPFAEFKAKAKVTGAGTLAAFGTGRPVTDENYTTGEFTSFHGRWQAIIRSGYETGTAELCLSVDGISDIKVEIPVKEET